jgi:hypothetical protein
MLNVSSLRLRCFKSMARRTCDQRESFDAAIIRGFPGGLVGLPGERQDLAGN